MISETPQLQASTPLSQLEDKTWLLQQLQPIKLPPVENQISSTSTEAAYSSKVMSPAKHSVLSVVKRGSWRSSPPSNESEKEWSCPSQTLVEESKVDASGSLTCKEQVSRANKVKHPKYKIAWSPEEDEELCELVRSHKENWNRISKKMKGKSEIKCYQRYLELKNDSNKQKGQWTPDEDKLLRELVNIEGPKNWSKISEQLPGRIGKQCRERWHNHLDPNINKKKWSPAEDELILSLHQKHGPKWCLIASEVPGRTDNAIKNRFNSNLKRQLKYGRVIGTYERVNPSRRYSQKKAEVSTKEEEPQVPSPTLEDELLHCVPVIEKKRDIKAAEKETSSQTKIFNSQETLQLSMESVPTVQLYPELDLPKFKAIRLSKDKVYCVPDFESYHPLMEVLSKLLVRRV